MSTPANSADEVFSKLTQFDESKHKRNHGQFSSNGGGGRDHWAGLKHGAGVGARVGAVLGGVPSALSGAAAAGFAAHQVTHGGGALREMGALGHSEEELAHLREMSALSGGKKAAIIGGAAALTGLTSGVLGAVHGGAGGAVLGGAIGAGVGRKKTKEESQAFVEGAKAAHEHNHGKDDDVAKNYVSTDVEEVFKSARDVVKPVSNALNGVGNTIQGAAKNPKSAAKAAWKTADAVSRNPKVAMGVGLGVAGAGAAGAYHHLKKNDDVSSDVTDVFSKARELNVEKGLGGLVDAEKIGGAVRTAKTGLGNIGSGVANGVERAGNKSLTAGGPKKLTSGLWHASDFARKNKVATGAAAIGAGTVAGGVAAKKTF